MFTGLIESVGTVLDIRKTTGAARLIVSAPGLANRWKIGDSISVNGVCLTAVEMQESEMQKSEDPQSAYFAADLAEETLRRTSLADAQPGSLVNLELPTPAGSPMGGHVVQGHVDATGTLVSLIPLTKNLDYTDWRMTIEVPESMVSSIISQGSITIDGISLTVAKMEGRLIEIAVIPHTHKATNLHSLKPGSQVNLEADVLSRYAAKRAALQAQPIPMADLAAVSEEPLAFANAEAIDPMLTPTEDGWLTTAYLMENGY